MKKSFCAFAAALSMTVSAASGFQPTGLNRNAYLDLMEPIVRLAAGWVDEKGAVIDPALNREWNQTTSRFVSSAAILLRFGRCPELLDTVRRAMTYSCSRLPETEVRESSPDFWMRELATAWYCLKPLVPPEESEAWRARLAAVEPENIYKFTDPAHKKLKEFHNWAVYSSGGESMRDSLGIGGGDFLWGNRFFDVYMAGQLHRLTPEGMYRDPGDPITYDITTRLQIANALHFGYRGEHFRILDNFLKTGGPTLLRFLSPEGFVPYGGRSAGMQFQEAIAAALCELEANRCKRLGDLESAGQFKRQAHLCIQAIRPYLTGRELYHVKNRFPPTSLHGCDGYAQYSVYLLFASSVLGQAALFADDSIAAPPCPGGTGRLPLCARPRVPQGVRVVRRQLRRTRRRRRSPLRFDRPRPHPAQGCSLRSAARDAVHGDAQPQAHPRQGSGAAGRDRPGVGGRHRRREAGRAVGYRNHPPDSAGSRVEMRREVRGAYRDSGVRPHACRAGHPLPGYGKGRQAGAVPL